MDATTTTEGYCPHCRLLVDPAAGPIWPSRPLRCRHCHLLIGTGRGQAEPSGEPGAKGAAAGVFSRRAKRVGADGTAHSSEELLRGLTEVARQLGEPVDRLLMVDYQQLAAADPELPPLSAVFAAFGSWKAARQAAARELPQRHDG